MDLYVAYLVSITLPSMIAMVLYFGLNIFRYFFNVCKNLTIYTGIYDIKQHFQNFMRANSSWMAGRVWPTSLSLDTSELHVFLSPYYLAIAPF